MNVEQPELVQQAKQKHWLSRTRCQLDTEFEKHAAAGE